jgi:hypothetical protein
MTPRPIPLLADHGWEPVELPRGALDRIEWEDEPPADGGMAVVTGEGVAP